jgi:hypothetical protein
MSGPELVSAACGSAPRHPSPAIDDWRGGRVAEGARLESVFTGNRNVGSNPTPSASLLWNLLLSLLEWAQNALN